MKKRIEIIGEVSRVGENTQEVDAIVAVTEPAGGPPRWKIDTIMRKIGLRHFNAGQVIIISNIGRGIAEHVNSRHSVAGLGSTRSS